MPIQQMMLGLGGATHTNAGDYITANLVRNYDASDTTAGNSGSSFPDLSGNNAHMSHVGATFSSAAGSPNYGGAYTFDGTDDYMVFDTPSVETSAQTVEVWCNLVNGASAFGGFGYILHNNSASTNTGSSYMTFGTNGSDNQRLYAAYDGEYSSMTSTTSGSGIVHMVLTYNGSSNQKFYLNNSQIASVSTSGPQNFESETTVGGMDPPNQAYRPTQGQLFSLRWYNAELSSSDVASNWNNRKAWYGLS